MKRRAFCVGLALSTTGCAGVWGALAKIAQVGQTIGSVIDYADSGQSAFFDRHPNMESERRVKAAVRAARATVATLDRAIAAAQAANDGDVAAARTAALKSYGELRSLLDELGVIEARAPEGGAETDAPLPQPLDLPTVEQLQGSV